MPEKARLRNDFLCVEWDVTVNSTQSVTAMHCASLFGVFLRNVAISNKKVAWNMQ